MRVALMHNINRHQSVHELEFDSTDTIEHLTRALAKYHEVVAIECHPNIVEWLDRLLRFKPDIIFSVAEGFHSAAREAFYPALYEQLDIAYCGSDPTTLLISHNKGLTNRLVESTGVRVPWWCTVLGSEELEFLKERFRYPLIVKPNSEGSGIALDARAIVHTFEELEARVRYVTEDFHNLALVQQYVPRGMDLSMTYIEGLGLDGVFGPVEYAYPEGDIFDHELKSRTYPQSILNFPQELSREVLEELHEATRRAIKILDVRGYGRADFRIDDKGTIYFLEMNGQGEFSPKRCDLLARVFQAGYSYEEVVLHIVAYATDHPRRLPSMAGLVDPHYILRRA